MSPNARQRPIVLVELSPSGGLFQFAFHLGEALASGGRPVQLITGANPELTSRTDGFTVRPLLPTWHRTAFPTIRNRALRVPIRAIRAGQLVVAWMILAVALLRTRPSVVLWQHWRFGFEAMFAGAITRLLRRKLFGAAVIGMIAHEAVPKSDTHDSTALKSGWLLERAFRSAWHAMDVAFVLGPHSRALAIEAWEPPFPVVIIPFGPGSALTTGPMPAPADETEPVALFFGTWLRYKGLDVLLDAFALVRAEMPEAVLRIVGDVGMDIDEDAVVRRGHEIGNVETMPGYLPIERVPAVITAARCVVTPYVRANQSAVINLAFTFGRPVVTSDAGDLGHAVTHGHNGFVVPVGEPEPLATAMLQLLRSPALAEKFGQDGRTVIESAWEIAARTIRDAVDDARVSG